MHLPPRALIIILKKARGACWSRPAGSLLAPGLFWYYKGGRGDPCCRCASPNALAAFIWFLYRSVPLNVQLWVRCPHSYGFDAKHTRHSNPRTNCILPFNSAVVFVCHWLQRLCARTPRQGKTISHSRAKGRHEKLMRPQRTHVKTWLSTDLLVEHVL